MFHTAPARVTLPRAREVKAAAEGRQALAAHLGTRGVTRRLQIFDERNQPHEFELPTSALRVLVDVLAELASGHAVQVIPIHAELSTQEAADLLNVSRPHLVKLLADGRLPHHLAGKHRRVLVSDVMAFKAERSRQSESALAELARQAQELNLGY